MSALEIFDTIMGMFYVMLQKAVEAEFIIFLLLFVILVMTILITINMFKVVNY